MASALGRCAARPFTSTRPSAVRSCVPVVPRHVSTSQRQSCEPVVRAAAAATDVELYDDEVDLPSAPVMLEMAGEKVRLRVRMRSYEKKLLEKCVLDLEHVAQVTGAEFKGPIMLPTKRRIYCVLRSPHVNKDAREHFEIRTHHRLVDLRNLSAETVSAMMSWVPPAGARSDALRSVFAVVQSFFCGGWGRGRGRLRSRRGRKPGACCATARARMHVLHAWHAQSCMHAGPNMGFLGADCAAPGGPACFATKLALQPARHVGARLHA